MGTNDPLQSPIFVEVCEQCEDIWPVGSMTPVYKQTDESPINICPDCFSSVREKERKLANKAQTPKVFKQPKKLS